MNPLFKKQTRSHRPVSAKVNPEEQKHNFLKPTNQSLLFQQQFDIRPKGIEASSAQILFDTKVKSQIQDHKDSFLKNLKTQNYPRLPSFSAREEIKSKLNPCNPFQSLTESSIRRNPENQKAMELILAHKKIRELENNVKTLTKELGDVKEQNFQFEKASGTHLSGMKRQVNELMKNNKELSEKIKQLEKENQMLNKYLKTEKALTLSQMENISQSPLESTTKSSQNFKTLGQQFERKINDLYQENYKLKNKLSWYEGKLEQSETLLSSVKQFNQMLEKRFAKQQAEDTTVKERLKKENDRLTGENLKLIEEKDRIKSQYEMDFLKLENQTEELKNQLKLIRKTEKKKLKQANNQTLLTEINHHPSSYKKINKLQDLVESLQFAVKDQLDQIIRLKQKNKKLSKMLSLGSH